MLNMIIKPSKWSCCIKSISKSLAAAYILMSFSIEKYVHFLLFDRELESKMYWVIPVWKSHQCSTDQLRFICSLLAHFQTDFFFPKATNQLMPIPQIWLYLITLFFFLWDHNRFHLNSTKCLLTYFTLLSSMWNSLQTCGVYDITFYSF